MLTMMAKRAMQTAKAGASVFIALMLILSVLPHSASASVSTSPVKHIIVMVQENHTFDNYFGTYPGANGINNYSSVPAKPGGPPAVRPYLLKNLTLAKNLDNSWNAAHKAYDNGKMDGFVVAERSNATMGYYDYHEIPYYWDYASQFVLLDNFYTSVMADSLPNHLYLIAGQSGGLTFDARFGKLDFTSNDVQNNTFEFKSIVDELEANNISWKYYSGGSKSLNNWNPLWAFSSIENNPSAQKNLVNTGQLVTDVEHNNLTSVAWVMPASDEVSEEPPANISQGEHAVVTMLNTIMSSPYWNSTAVFLTWDDWGGWYDHVPPPQVDGFGYGFRVPCLIISPYSRHGFIDHTQSDFTSILKFIETVHSLPPLTSRDALANNLMEAFDFSQTPSPPLVLPGPFMIGHYPPAYTNGTLYKGATSSRSALIVASTTTVTATVKPVPSSPVPPWAVRTAELYLLLAALAVALLLVMRAHRHSELPKSSGEAHHEEFHEG